MVEIKSSPAVQQSLVPLLSCNKSTKPIVAVSWRFFHRPWPYTVAHPFQEEKPAVPEKLPPTAAEIKVGHCVGDVTLSFFLIF